MIRSGGSAYRSRSMSQIEERITLRFDHERVSGIATRDAMLVAATHWPHRHLFVDSRDFQSVHFRAPIRPRQPLERNAATITAMHVFCVACFPVATYVAQSSRWAAVALVESGFITILFGIALRRYVFHFLVDTFHGAIACGIPPAACFRWLATLIVESIYVRRMSNDIIERAARALRNLLAEHRDDRRRSNLRGLCAMNRKTPLRSSACAGLLLAGLSSCVAPASRSEMKTYDKDYWIQQDCSKVPENLVSVCT